MDYTIREPESGLVFNLYTHEMIEKLAETSEVTPQEEYEHIMKHIKDKQIFEKKEFHFAVYDDTIKCLAKGGLCRSGEHFDHYEDAKDKFMDNCMSMGMNPLSAAERLRKLKGQKSLFEGRENVRIVSKSR